MRTDPGSKNVLSDREDLKNSPWLVPSWITCVGTGEFLMGLGVLFWGIGRMRSKKE